MKKITISSIIFAFVLSASAQFIQTPRSEMVNLSETSFNTSPLSPLEQGKNLFNGWIYPFEIGKNLNSGSIDFYDYYSQPIWPDSTVVTIGADGKHHVWMHSIGYSFDARSLALDENLAQVPVSGAYRVDSIVVAAWYELRNNKYDTLLIEIGAVNADDNVSLVALTVGGDSNFVSLKTNTIGTQQYGLATEWSNPNKTTFKYTLTQNDTTLSNLKHIKIPLPNEIIVGVNQILGVNITFIPGCEYALGDTLEIYGSGQTPKKLNSFLFYFMEAQDEYGLAFYDPHGNNAFNFNDRRTRYQIWSNPILNDCLYPYTWGAANMGFKVADVSDSLSLLTYSVAGLNGTITASIDGGSVPSNSYVRKGKNIIFTANPAAGYEVKNWKLNNVIISGNTSNTYVLTNIQQASDVKVEFQPILTQYLITYNVVGTNGSLVASVNGNTIASNSNVPQGSSVIFIASPSAGYQVKEWKLNSTIISGNTSNSFAISSLQESSNVTVEFEPIRYIVIYSLVGANGSLSATVDGVAFSSGYAIEEGKNVIFTATPNAHYRVKEWKLNNVVVSGNVSNNFTINNIQSASNVTVEFERITHSVTYSVVNGNGSLSATVDGVAFSSGYAIEEGKNIFFTATPNAHYRVKEWKLNDVVIGGNTSNTFTINNLQETSNITVEFESINYVVTYNVIGANGTLVATSNSTNIPSGSLLQEGSSLVFTASPNSGYRVKEWKLNSTIVGGNTSHNYNLTLTQTSNITVEFEPIPANSHIVTYSVVNGNGSLSATVDGVAFSSGYAIEEGKNVIFTATPNAQYRVKEWKLNDVVIGGNTSNTFTISNLQEASNVTVEFEPIPTNSHLVTYSVVNGNGSLSAMVDGVSFSSGYAIEEGKNVIFTATPNAQYRVKEWKLNDVVIGGNTINTFTISNLQEASNVTVEFIPDDVGISDGEKISINIYPNPSYGAFNILADNQYTMEVMDIQGRIVLHRQIEKGVNELNMHTYNNGVYFVRLRNESHLHVLQIHKMK